MTNTSSASSTSSTTEAPAAPRLPEGKHLGALPRMTRAGYLIEPDMVFVEHIHASKFARATRPVRVTFRRRVFAPAASDGLPPLKSASTELLWSEEIAPQRDGTLDIPGTLPSTSCNWPIHNTY